MSTTIIEIKCEDQTLSLVESPEIASGGKDENEVKFTFSEHWTGFAKKALFYRNTNAIYRVDIDSNNSCIIPAIVLTEAGKLYISVYGTSGTVRRTSDVIVYRIVQGSNADAPDPLEQYKAEWQAGNNTELADALTTSATASGISPVPAYEEMDWDELVDEVEGNLIYTEEEQAKVSWYDTFKGIYERSTTLPKILTPTSGITELYSVPYINTSLMTEKAGYNNIKINSRIQKCGFDLTSAPDQTICGGSSRLFSDATSLTDVKLTNCQTQITWNNAFSSKTNLVNVELYGFNENHNSSAGWLFSGCSSLESINFVNGVCQEDLDLAGIVHNQTFNNCYLLKNIRIKANTIQASISFAQSSVLTGESVLSIINGLEPPIDSKTLTLSTVTKNSCLFWCGKENEETGLYEFCETETPGALTFTDIISIKGWTLA